MMAKCFVIFVALGVLAGCGGASDNGGLDGGTSNDSGAGGDGGTGNLCEPFRGGHLALHI